MKDFTTIKIEREIINKFKILSAKTNKLRSKLIEEALNNYINEKMGDCDNGSNNSSND
jgi:predicted DNA-binding protein